MEWRDVGRVVAPLAPALGGILGGLIPLPGGALAGQALGAIIARRFGVEPTPQAVSDAVQKANADVAVAKLREATEIARVEVDGFKEAERQYYETIRTSLEQTGESTRLEVLPENRHWFFTGWRPAAGWLFDIFAAAFGVLLVFATAIALGGNKAPLNTLVEAWPAYLALLGPLALMVGVYVFGRSTEKAAVAKAVTPEKKK